MLKEGMKTMTKHISDNKMKHIHSVAEYMYEHANEHDLDSEEMYMLGLLHDVGYIKGHTGHTKNGAEIAKQIGVNPRLVYAIENHGMNLNKLENVTPELILLVRADLQINHLGEFVGYEKRLHNVKMVYGETSMQYTRVLGTIEYLKQNGWYKMK